MCKHFGKPSTVIFSDPAILYPDMSNRNVCLYGAPRPGFSEADAEMGISAQQFMKGMHSGGLLKGQLD